jgi:hypothetical protein
VPTVEVSRLSIRLDEDHVPETNGRMAVCRRCGATTDGPTGQSHVLSESQIARVGRWLDDQARQSRVAEARAQMP